MNISNTNKAQAKRWMKQRGARYQQFVSRLTEPGVYEVGGLGACTLIHRQALLRGVNYKRIYNLSFWGGSAFLHPPPRWALPYM